MSIQCNPIRLGEVARFSPFGRYSAYSLEFSNKARDRFRISMLEGDPQAARLCITERVLLFLDRRNDSIAYWEFDDRYKLIGDHHELSMGIS